MRVLAIGGVSVGVTLLVEARCCDELAFSCELDWLSGGGGGRSDIVPPDYDFTDRPE